MERGKSVQKGRLNNDKLQEQRSKTKGHKQRTIFYKTKDLQNQ